MAKGAFRVGMGMAERDVGPVHNLDLSLSPNLVGYEPVNGVETLHKFLHQTRVGKVSRPVGNR